MFIRSFLNKQTNVYLKSAGFIWFQFKNPISRMFCASSCHRCIRQSKYIWILYKILEIETNLNQPWYDLPTFDTNSGGAILTVSVQLLRLNQRSDPHYIIATFSTKFDTDVHTISVQHSIAYQVQCSDNDGNRCNYIVGKTVLIIVAKDARLRAKRYAIQIHPISKSENRFCYITHGFWEFFFLKNWEYLLLITFLDIWLK